METDAEPEIVRWLWDPPQAGARNMAVDQAILESIAASGRGTLRFYQWEPATVSLGYFQRVAEREGHVASRECPIVRRATGGGAIVHDVELTYSLCLPSHHRFSRAHRDLYDVVHQALLATLASLGAPGGTLCPGRSQVSAAEPFLCFLRRSSGDVLFANYKICGSAQRRVEGAILQHGSLLLRKSNAAPELPGLYDLSNCTGSLDEIAKAWGKHLETGLNAVLVPGELSAAEQQAAARIQRERFSHSDWTARR